MKCLFFVNETLSKSSGISKKVLSQVKAMENNKIDVYFSFLVEEKEYILRKIGDMTSDKFKNNILGKIKTYMTYKNLLNYIINNDIDFIYIRYTHFSNYFFNKFLQALKENNVKIFLEIPTYPYDMEYKRTIGYRKIKFFIEKYYRKKMYKFITRVVTFSEDDEIFGIKTTKIINGVDLKNIEKVNINFVKSGISFIGVAGIAFWHGYDRFILSIANYYKKAPLKKVVFHIVGEGNKRELNELKKLVQKNKLEKYVIFHGSRFGEELDEIYNKSNIAIGSLGRFRSGIVTMKALKNREYAARGLPMVYSEMDLDFEKEKFVYKVQHDESLIDIEKIIEWYKNLKVSSEEIREFSKQFSWDIQMKKVIDEIKIIK